MPPLTPSIGRPKTIICFANDAKESSTVKIELRQGDITHQQDIDAIVNAANTELWLGSGVAGAIRSAGGPDIEREAVAQGPISLGQAVRTTAGNLPNRFVIHAAAMGYRDVDRAVPKRAGSASSEAIIRNATANSILIADQSGCNSIGFPALATGIGGFPLDECARVMITAARDYAENHATSNVERVLFVLFTEDDFQAFRRELEKIETS
jgi:O-acetyl-ADP-ribose deacetylase (regulator of RNase III)